MVKLPKLKKIANSPSGITKALKNDDQQEVMRALETFNKYCPRFSSPDKELRMSPDEYREFFNAIKDNDLDKARGIYGVEMDVKFEKPVAMDDEPTKPVGVSNRRSVYLDVHRNGSKSLVYQGSLGLPDGSFADLSVGVPTNTTKDDVDSWSDDYLEEMLIKEYKLDPDLSFGKNWLPGGHSYKITDNWKTASNLINSLTKIANKLDQKGYYDLANELDEVIKGVK